MRSEVAARTGTVVAPFVLESDYVTLPGAANTRCSWTTTAAGERISTCSGSVSFEMSCNADTSIKFEAEVYAPDGNSDSFYVSVDGSHTSSRYTWHTGSRNGWRWSSQSGAFRVYPGSHTVQLHGREDGIKFRTLRIAGGSTVCTFGSVGDSGPRFAIVELRALSQQTPR
eukprot:4019536-Prymnesium_polylepis.1